MPIPPVEPWWGKYLPYTVPSIAAMASAFFSWRAQVAGKAAVASSEAAAAKSAAAVESSVAHHESDKAEHAEVRSLCEGIYVAVANGNGNGKVKD